MGNTKVGIRDVLDFFDHGELETVELALELGDRAVKTRKAKGALISANLKKARAARGKGKGAKAQNLATDEADVRPASLRARHAGEPAEHVQAAVVGAVSEG